MWQSLKRWVSGWTNVESPLTEERRQWIDERWAWLENEFGTEQLHKPLLTPSYEDFPEDYAGLPEDAERLLTRICEHMGVDRSRLELRLFKSDVADEVAAAFNSRAHQGYALGVYEPTDTTILIWLEQTHLHDAMSVISTLAHEVGHVLLLADGRCSPEEPDHEPLTDLLTVFFGLGIFTANSTVRSVNWRYGNWEGWSVSRQGYLTMPDLAYALARYAEARGELPPPWQNSLRADMRSLLKYEMHRLERLSSNAHSALTVEEPVADEGIGQSGTTASDLESDTPDEPGLSTGDEHFSQGEFYTSQGNYEAAVEQFALAITQQPDDWEAYQKRAMVLMYLDRFEESIADATKAIEHGTPDCDPYVYRSCCLIALGEFTKALDDANQAVRIGHDNSGAYQVRAIAKSRLGELSTALADINRAIALDPRVAVYYLVRSYIYVKTGDELQARRNEEEAIRRDERFSDESFRCKHTWWMYQPSIE